jgi:molybdopterin-guanine dinucleotide biosynthesis protein A
MTDARIAESEFMTTPIMPDSSPINGLILAGGQSTRMGKDKGQISFHGKPQREYLFDLLSPYCQRVFLSCKQTDQQLPPYFNTIKDNYITQSPLNGILSAFDNEQNIAWLTVPVDMPLVDAKTLSFLISNRAPDKMATCFFDSDGKNPEPLLTLWEPKCYPSLKAFQASGKISPRDFLKQSDIKLLSIPDQKILTNINSTDELEKYLQEKNLPQ